jgi:uridylate kinase
MARCPSTLVGEREEVLVSRGEVDTAFDAESLRYQRVVIKVSGEALRSFDGPHDLKRMTSLAQTIASVHEMGLSIIIMVGGGNIFRWKNAAEWQLDRFGADKIGMVSTSINALLLEGLLQSEGVSTQVLSRGPCTGITTEYSRELALEALGEGQMVLIAGGMGISGVSTDYPAVHDAIEMQADAVIMAKHGVDGVYSADPRRDSSASFLPEVTASCALAEQLHFMDATALVLARDNMKYIHVVGAEDPGSIRDILVGKNVGSVVLPW